MAQKVRVIIGASYGDEGKGLATDYFGAQHMGAGTIVNVLTNGGAQRGHTVQLPGGIRHVFKHFGAASFRGAATYMAHQFIVNPMQLVREYEELAGMGVTPEFTIHPQCRFSTPWDMLANQKLKEISGVSNTCGFGIWETVLRYDRGYGIPYAKISVMGREERVQYLRSLRDGYFAARTKELGIRVEDDEAFFSEGLPGLPCNLRRSDVGPGVPGPVTAGQKELYLFPLFPSLKRAPQGERKAGLKARKGRDHVNKKTQKLIRVIAAAARPAVGEKKKPVHLP